VAKKGPKPVDPIERFHRHYIPEPNSGCWLWLGTVGTAGYGGFVAKSYNETLAHRFAYKAFVGPIPEDMTVDHRCNVKICVNPDHMRLMTRGQNTSRYYDEMTSCRAGHPYTDENTWVSKNGFRYCRTCSRLRDISRYYNKRRVSKKPIRKGSNGELICRS
jgi:hypothetical protein